MNTEQAKKLSLPDLLEKLGHVPVREKKGGYELWYRSPFRKEAEPSFHTSFIGGKWIWNDFGDQGGTVIDFVMRYENFTSIKDALAYLSDHFQPGLFSNAEPKPPKQSFSFQQQPDREAVEIFSEDSQLELIEALPITKPLILSYLAKERHIPAPLARKYLLEVRYRNSSTGKEYFAFGMLNQAGGYEIRVASSKYNFKSALNARDITVIPGSQTEGKSVHVFEGMTDFLSYLVLTGKDALPEDVIIMHSLSSFPRTIAHIQSQGYQIVHTFLDNDKSGKAATARFQEALGSTLQPQNHTFAPYGDLNDYLRARSAREKA